MSLSRLAPWVFVFLWSTGFIGSKLGAPFAEPVTFLAIRFLIATLALAALVRVLREAWPSSLSECFHTMVVGVLLHAGYLGGVFIAIDRGVNAGFSALVVGLQPVLTVALAALWLKESLDRRKLLGVVAGLAGVALVVYGRGFGPGELDSIGVGFCAVALVSITVGTVYQKRFASDVPLLSGVCLQYVAAAAVLWPISTVSETQHIEWSPVFLFALIWLVIVLSIGAVCLLMYLIRQGEAGEVASLFYLVPPIVAVQATLLFDEKLSPMAILGFVLCAFAVAWIHRKNPNGFR